MVKMAISCYVYLITIKILRKIRNIRDIREK